MTASAPVQPPLGRHRRRGRDEGSIYQRKDGRWVAQVPLPGGRRKLYYAKTRAAAAARLLEGMRSALDGLPLPSSRETVGRFLRRWFTEAAIPTLRPSSATSYEGLLRLHLIPSLGRIPLSRLGPEDVHALMNAKLKQGLSPRRVDYMRAVLRSALNDAIRWGLVSRNAAALARGPKAVRFEAQPLTPAQARLLLDALRGDRLEALYRVALALGLRQGEALGLSWSDVDFDGGIIHIRRSLQRVQHEFRLMEPKSSRSVRSLGPIPVALIDSLRDHRKRQAEDRMLAGAKWEGTWDLVFMTATGSPLHGTTVTKSFQARVRAAGLPPLRFHDLRHACASLLLAQGVNPRVVMEILGHSQVSLTLNTYSHVLPGIQGEALADLQELLRRA